MTNKEAIENLKGCICGYEVGDDGKPNGNVTADLKQETLDMAIKALKQEPCDDAISRADAKKYLSAPDANGDRVIYESDLDLLPSVTPQPKMGHWIEHKSNGIHHIECSECSSWFLKSYLVRNSYCPNCGAKMIENEEEFDNLDTMLEDLWNATESEEKRMNIKLDEGAFKPIREHKTDAGLDLRTPEEFVIKPNDSYIIDTGVHIELPKGYYGKLESKSGLNVKHNIVCLGGTIDEPYRGSIVVKLYNVGKEEYRFNKGDKIVQLVIQPYLAPDIEYTDKLSETDRGDNGFGSTGK